jgi:hypothetical protein
MSAVPSAAQTGSSQQQVTFNKHIMPILQRSCQNCHRPDSIAPMSLLSYQEARPYARAMKQRTALARSKWGRGAMPPWYIEKNIGIQKFKADPSLSDEEIALIAAWADSGAPEGDPADLPPPLKLAEVTAWTLGKPDLIASTPKITVKGVEPDQWVDLFPCCSTLDGAVTENRFVASAEYKEVPLSGPRKRRTDGTVGNLFIIHHTGASITDGPPAEGARRHRLTTHEVGRNAVVLPADAGVPLKVGSQIEWGQFHIHAPGVPGEDVSSRMSVGLKLHPRGYKPKYQMVAYSSMGNTELEIAAGAQNQTAEAFFVAPRPMKLVNFEPHMHADGVRKCLQAIYQRSVETLNCSGYDHNWVRNYQYEDDYMPIIPKGTILRTIAWFDNSASNDNVIEPRNQANWGRRSVVNMLIMFNDAILLTDEQYEEELAKRRAYLDRTDGWGTLIGCPGCWEKPTPQTTTRRSAPAGKNTKIPNLGQGASADLPELPNLGSNVVD